MGEKALVSLAAADECTALNDLLLRRHVSPREHRRLLPFRARRARRPAWHPEAPHLRQCVSRCSSRVQPTDLTIGTRISPGRRQPHLRSQLLLSHLLLDCVRPIDPIGHAIAMGTFGFAGYWAYQWDQRAAVLLAAKRAEIAERRAKAEGSAST